MSAMDKAEVRRLIEHAQSLGLDPGKVLQWRLNFEPRPRRHVGRPKGTLSMGDARKKYGITTKYLLDLRRKHGLPTRKKANLILVEEEALKEWMAKFPPS